MSNVRNWASAAVFVGLSLPRLRRGKQDEKLPIQIAALQPRRSNAFA
jgi:hypothetical protein